MLDSRDMSGRHFARHYLAPLFEPATVALIGASRQAGSVGAILMSLSTIVVALNAQLLRRLDLRPDTLLQR